MTPNKKNYPKEYMAWKALKGRCYNCRNHKYPIYGGRGISVSNEWKNSFSQFLKDMGPAPAVEYSVDRIDVNGNYEANNCKWATAKQQGRNKTTTLLVESPWGKISLAEAAELSGMNYNTLKSRIKYGYKGEEIFNPKSIKNNGDLSRNIIVLNVENGVYFDSIVEASASLGRRTITQQYLGQMLKGRWNNRTPLIITRNA